MSIFNFIKRRSAISITLSVALSFAFVAVAVNGATTISTNIVTGGTLSVTGLTSLIQATSTRLSVVDTAYFGGTATSTFDSAGNLTVIGTLSVTGLSTMLGGATTTTLTLLNGEVISNATDGTIQLGGIASTTSITLLNGETITNAVDGSVAIDATNTGIGSTTPEFNLSIGTLNATSTTGGGFFCNHYQDEAGRQVWITLATSGNTVFSTSTTPCNN